jgi:hypothetical protein
MAGKEGYVSVPKRTFDTVERTARDAFESESEYFEENKHYEHPEFITGYMSYAETRLSREEAKKQWVDIATKNIREADIPDKMVVETAAEHLSGMGYNEQAGMIRRMLETKIGKTEKKVFEEAGVGDTTVRRFRSRSGLAGKVTTAIFVVSLLGVVGLASGGITGAVTGAARTSAAWNVVLSLIALLSGLFLAANKE